MWAQLALIGVVVSSTCCVWYKAFHFLQDSMAIGVKFINKKVLFILLSITQCIVVYTDTVLIYNWFIVSEIWNLKKKTVVPDWRMSVI